MAFRRIEPPAPPHGPAVGAHPLRVCLVRPPVVTAPRSLSYYGAVPDLGLAYVAAAAREAGHAVAVVDGPGAAISHGWTVPTGLGPLRAHGLELDAIVDAVAPDTEVIGVTQMFLHEWPLTAELLRRLRRAHPHALIVAGGENATAMAPRMLAQCEALDAIVRGEGEDRFVALLAAAGAGRSPASVPGVVTRARLDMPASAPSRRVELDALPWPAWDLFPIEAYLAHRHGSGVDLGRALPVLTSRGCPYRCSFCSSPQMWGTRYVRRDPERVLDEIEFLQRRYRVQNVNINDLTALLTKQWLLELCAAIERRGLRFTWQLPSGTRSEAIDREAAQRLVAAGCRNFCYAPESGAPTELTRMRKRVVPDRLLHSMRGAVDAGMVTHASIIIGMPGQSGRELLQTTRFIATMAWAGLHTLSVMVFAPYPGSEAYADAVAAGRIDHDERWIYGSLLRSIGGGRSHHGRWGPRRLQFAQLGLLGGFFALSWLRRPKRMLDTVRTIVAGRQRTVLEQLLAAKLRPLHRRWRERFAAGASVITGR